MFLFSSRRRHTRCGRDWSSDVCSSDLWLMKMRMVFVRLMVPVSLRSAWLISRAWMPTWLAPKIGRASCRERVEVRADARVLVIYVPDYRWRLSLKEAY